MNEVTNYAEYCVEKRSEGSYKRKRILLRLICVLAAVAIIPAVTYSEGARFFIAFVPVWMGIMIIVYWFLSRFVNIEYEYRILQGSMQMDIIYGQKQRKQLFDIRIRNMHSIRPYDPEEEICKKELSACVNVTDCLISRKNPTPDAYYFTYTDERQNTCAVLFEATTKVLSLMKFHNKTALTIKEGLRH